MNSLHLYVGIPPRFGSNRMVEVHATDDWRKQFPQRARQLFLLFGRAAKRTHPGNSTHEAFSRIFDVGRLFLDRLKKLGWVGLARDDTSPDPLLTFEPWLEREVHSSKLTNKTPAEHVDERGVGRTERDISAEVFVEPREPRSQLLLLLVFLRVCREVNKQFIEGEHADAELEPAPFQLLKLPTRCPSDAGSIKNDFLHSMRPQEVSLLF